ncbi:MAG: hypothetical protein ACI9NQ_000905 [Paracoccaceae bacterium]|jgi:hypothetical protein
MKGLPLLLLPVLLLGGCASQRGPLRKPPAWGEVVSREVNALGIQNWVIVAESSFPVVSRRGVRTIVVDAEVPELVDYVVNELEKSETVTPSFSTARELPFVKNDRAPGVDEFRKLLKTALHGHPVREMDHRSLTLLAHSDSAKYAVLVLKTKTALPYSSVFIELDSGYWDRDSEDNLRRDMTTAQDKIQRNETNN